MSVEMGISLVGYTSVTTVMEDEVGANPRHLADIVLGLVRSGELYRIDSPEAESVEPGDRLLYIRRVTGEEVRRP